MSKIIVAGSRDITDYFAISHILNQYEDDFDECISGTARGVDSLAASWARARDIPVIEFPADWEHLGKRAGILRNMQMGNYGDKLIAIWDGKSSGTRQMIEYMKSLDKPTQVFII